MTTLLGVGGIAAVSAGPALASPTVVPLTSTDVTLTSAGAAASPEMPVTFTMSLTTGDANTLVAPTQIQLTWPSGLGLNAAAETYGIKTFGSTGTVSAANAAPAKATPVSSVSITSAAFSSFGLPPTVKAPVYLVTDDANGTYGLGVEITVPFGSGTYADYLGDIKLSTGPAQISLNNLLVPGTSEPVAWSTFSMAMPSKTSLSVASVCGAGGQLIAALTDSNSTQTYKAPFAITCPPAAPKVSATKFTGLKAGKPALSFTVADGARATGFNTVTVALPKGLSFKKASTKDLKVSGAKVKSVKASGSKLTITLKSSVKSAKVTISKVIKETSSLKSKIKSKKTKSLSVKVTAYGKTATTTIKKLS